MFIKQAAAPAVAAIICLIMISSVVPPNQLQTPLIVHASESVAAGYEQTNTIQNAYRVGERIALEYQARNDADVKQPFTLIAQVTDEEGYTQAIFWSTDLIQSHESKMLQLAWVPNKAGNYTIQLFTWGSIIEDT